MTLINAWWAPCSTRDGVERRVVVRCDWCVPPRLAFARTADYMSVTGWRFAELERGTHACPWCASRRGSQLRRRGPAQRFPALPNLLIIGAGKCGTTSLHGYIGEHPQAHMSTPKELRFFEGPDYVDRLDLYASFFDGRAKVRGESSPIYTTHPLVPGVPQRIRAALPDVKLIYLVRDPVERVAALYAERHAHGPYTEPPTDALGDFSDRHNPYMAPGRYATQLERYLPVFNRDRVLVVDQADLLHRRRETLRRLFRFLGLEEDFWSPSYERLRNVRESKVWWSPTATRLAESRVAVTMRRMIPDRPRSTLLRPVKALTTSRLRMPRLDEELRERIRAVSRDEVERLREITGQRFATWRV